MVILEEFGIYLQYVRKLGFEETPDYDFLRELFDKVLERQGEHDDSLYDWVLMNEGKGWEVKALHITDTQAPRRLTFLYYRTASSN